MFVFDSFALRNYRNGTIVVMAESIEVAKQKVRDEFCKSIIDYHDFLVDGEFIEEYEEEFFDLLIALESDLSKIPVETDVLFINGSS